MTGEWMLVVECSDVVDFEAEMWCSICISLS